MQARPRTRALLICHADFLKGRPPVSDIIATDGQEQPGKTQGKQPGARL